MSVSFVEKGPMKWAKINILQPLGNSASRLGVKKRRESRGNFLLGLLFVVAITGVYAGALADKTFPVAEGWYTQYASLINNGSVPYRDFEYLFFPLYLYIMAGITSVFGYSIIVLRIVGVLVFIGIGVAAYLVFDECFSTLPAAVAGSVTALFLQSEVAQIFYDYIRFMDLFVYIAVFFLIRAVKAYAAEKNRFPIDGILAGLFSAAACLIKQSSGLLFVCYCIVLFLFLALVGSKPKSALLYCASYVVAVVAAIGGMLAWLAANGALSAFFDLTLGGAVSAKGGIGTVLFAWIGNLFLSAGTFMPTVAGVVVIILVNMWFYYEYPLYQKEKQQRYALTIFGVAALVALLICLNSKTIATYFSQQVIGNAPSIVYVPVALLFLGMGVYYLVARFSRLHNNRDFITLTFPFFALIGAVFALGYGSGTSGGLCESQTALAMGVLGAVALQFSQHRYEKIMKTALLVVSICILCVTGSRKMVTPYLWWGQTTGSLWSESETTTIPLLSGIKVSSSEKQTLEAVYDAVQQYSKPGDTMYTFPQIPIFYKMCDRSSISYAQVQWFDVSTEKSMYVDMQRLCAAPPKVLVVCNVPQSTSSGHENAFNDGRPSQERIMANFLAAFTEENGYQRVVNRGMAIGYSLDVYVSTDDTKNNTTYKMYWDKFPKGSKYQLINELITYCDDYQHMDFYLNKAENYYDMFDRKKPTALKKEITAAMVAKAFNPSASGFMMDKVVYRDILTDDTYADLCEQIGSKFALCAIDNTAVTMIAKQQAKSTITNAASSIQINYENGFAVEQNETGGTFLWGSKDAQLALYNYLPTQQQVTISMDVYAPTDKAGNMVVRCGAQSYETNVNTDPQQRTIVEFPLTLEPGVNVVTLHTTLERYIASIEDERHLYFRVEDLKLNGQTMSLKNQ